MRNILALLRVRQWIKNGFIILPFVFSGLFLHLSLWKKEMLAVIAFSLISSGFYIINDILDKKRDSNHPVKALRPIASGNVSKSKAIIIAILVLAAGMIASVRLGPEAMGVIGLYFILQLLYNGVTKNIVIADVLTIALGFILRVWLGAVVVGIEPSVWLQLCVLVLALFLGFSKRRHEILFLKDDARVHRKVLSDYSVYFLDQLILVSATLTLVFYVLYTISDDVTRRIGSGIMLYSLVFVAYGIFRYFYLVHVKKMGGDPGEVAFVDVPLLSTVIIWGFFVMFVMLGAGQVR